jgi:isocitrate lyase
MRVLILPVLPLVLSGCVVASVADAAVDVATLPVKAVSKGVDLATTSQSEADEKRGRELRKAEEKAGREAREAEKRCREMATRGETCPPPPPANPSP